jgi:hypothetical protein
VFLPGTSPAAAGVSKGGETTAAAAMTATMGAFGGMGLDEFRGRVRAAFGDDLHRASPATVREFLDGLHSGTPLTTRGDARIVIDETAKSYEEVMRTFFVRVLDLPAEEAVRMLWAVAFDLSYAVIESQDAERIGHLFKGLEEPTP